MNYFMCCCDKKMMQGNFMQDLLNDNREYIDSYLTLPYQRFDTAPGNRDQLDCAICLLDFNKSDLVTVTPCKHIMHHSCLAEWEKRTCPLCRQTIRR
jgi:hypothetical protein